MGSLRLLRLLPSSRNSIKPVPRLHHLPSSTYPQIQLLHTARSSVQVAKAYEVAEVLSIFAMALPLASNIIYNIYIISYVLGLWVS